MMTGEQLLQWLPQAGAAVVFAWGVFKFSAEQRNLAKARRIEAARPFLALQMQLYTEATQLAAAIATAGARDEVKIRRFKELYSGELVMVEDQRVAIAMKTFRDCLDKDARDPVLEQHSRRLARECRDSLGNSWGVQAWGESSGSEAR